MKVLVTGGSGFLGSHVADILDDLGHKVTILDKSKSKWLRESQKFIEGNIKNHKTLEEAITNQDVVYHFASQSFPEASFLTPVSTLTTNIIGTSNLLEELRLAKERNHLISGLQEWDHSVCAVSESRDSGSRERNARRRLRFRASRTPRSRRVQWSIR